MTLVFDCTPITQTLDIDDTTVTLLLELIRFPKKNDNENGNEKDHFDKHMPADYIYWVLIARKHIFDAHLPDGVLLPQCTSEEIAAT
jgi:hypothetical protein